jgi:hypothetical protein
MFNYVKSEIVEPAKSPDTYYQHNSDFPAWGQQADYAESDKSG